MSTIDEVPSLTENLENSLEFETLIARISSRFINLPTGEVDREIEGALHRICEPLGIDLAVLWQWSLVDSTAILPTHAYCFEASLRPSTPMSQEQYPWSVGQSLISAIRQSTSGIATAASKWTSARIFDSICR